MNQITYQNSTLSKDQPVVWTALITPLLSNDEIDYVSLRSLVLQQKRAGNGILLLGSTGEGLALTSAEQFALVQYVCELNAGLPIMVAVGGFNLASQVSWIKACNKLPISAFLLGSPIYAKPGPVGQTHWFRTLLDTAERPCMLYNVPSRSGVDIPVVVIQALQSHKNCWALKEASGDINTFLNYRQHCSDIELFSGEDAMMPQLASAGVKGLVSVCANVWPCETKHYVELALAGQHHTLFPVWLNAIHALFQVANPIPVKVLMKDLQQISHAKLRAPLQEEELAKNHTLHQEHKRIVQWFQELKKHSTEQNSSTINS